MKSISKQVSTVADMETQSVNKGMFYFYIKKFRQMKLIIFLAENLLSRITQLEEKLIFVTDKTIGINNGLNEVNFLLWSLIIMTIIKPPKTIFF